MPYQMQFYIDGGCRNNGYEGAFGAAAAVLMARNNQPRFIWTRPLIHNHCAPTNQRAELTAVILALEAALQQANNLSRNPYINLTIFTDSRYVEGCMTDWSLRWQQNDFRNARGAEVANRDLIDEALRLKVNFGNQKGKVCIEWVPRAQNQDADKAVNGELDDMANGINRSSWS